MSRLLHLARLRVAASAERAILESQCWPTPEARERALHLRDLCVDLDARWLELSGVADDPDDYDEPDDYCPRCSGSGEAWGGGWCPWCRGTGHPQPPPAERAECDYYHDTGAFSPAFWRQHD